MSYEFFNVREVTARKQHICEHCRKPIEVGERHHYAAGKWEGDFTSYREHQECREAWSELNFTLRDLYPDERAAFLADDEWCSEDKEWIRETYPIVAIRMGFDPTPTPIERAL